MQSDLYAHQESELQIWKRKFISTVFPGPKENFSLDFICNMTFEESSGVQTSDRMDAVGKALEEVLSAALPQGCITVGVYEAAKSLNADPDNVVLCLLATDEGDDRDVALQIHFTLIRAFCCENDINILRVKNMRRLAEILGGGKQGGEPMDMHCVLVTNPYPSTSGNDPTALRKVNYFCRESRSQDQWVPAINLPER
ncbi:growth arrest and DNA damage-inducible protein GADD45 alpha-like isoform X1 [Polypterus senegalus]|nr:growth arrest and DNA damage-inducible protein GADD45 alpha-like isoform X1 [Polypterus senegalus]